MLERLGSVHDIKKLNILEQTDLAAELRDRIVSVVADNGGHLASNLGTIELTVALLHTFDPDEDAILWDVGHQCYAYKILTGRAEQFSTLRKTDGLQTAETIYQHQRLDVLLDYWGDAYWKYNSSFYNTDLMK